LQTQIVNYILASAKTKESASHPAQRYETTVTLK
jgi:hypothetical protein